MRTEPRLGELLFSAILGVLGLFAFAQTGAWPVKAALYPRVMASALVAASAACCVFAALGKENKGGGPVELAFESELPPHLVRRRTLEGVGWIGGFLALGWLVGLIPAMVLLVLGYLWWVGRERWWFVGAVTLGTWLALEGFLVRLLHVPIPTGVVSSLLVR